MQTGKQPFRHPLGDDDQDARRGDIVTVEELRTRFVAFRRDNPRNTRIPADLRAAVVAAMRRGVTPTRLRRACGLSTSQLARWRAGARERRRATLRSQHARVFSVVGEAPPCPQEPTAPPPAHDLELRLGPWSVSVRLAEQPDATRV
jgi:transposase-like protein